MYSYLIGKIICINKKSIILENNYTGYLINVASVTPFEQGKVKKVYVYKHIANNNNKNNLQEDMYGFETAEKKMLFLQLIAISGIGPKTALNICNNDIQLLKQTIASRGLDSLATLNGLSLKYARLVIDNLADLYQDQLVNQSSLPVNNLVNALKSLGYGTKDIDLAIKQLDLSNPNVELSDLISHSIKLIATAQSNNEHATAI